MNHDVARLAVDHLHVHLQIVEFGDFLENFTPTDRRGDQLEDWGVCRKVDLLVADVADGLLIEDHSQRHVFVADFEAFFHPPFEGLVACVEKGVGWRQGSWLRGLGDFRGLGRSGLRPSANAAGKEGDGEKSEDENCG